MRRRPKIGEILLQMQAIEDGDLETALGRQRSVGGRLGACLLDLDLCHENAILRALSLQFGLATVRLNGADIDLAITRLVPAELARKFRIVPLALTEGSPRKTLTVATDDPWDTAALEALEVVTGYKVVSLLASDRELTDAIHRIYGSVTRVTARDEVLSVTRF